MSKSFFEFAYGNKKNIIDKENLNGIAIKVNSKKRIFFNIDNSLVQIETLLNGKLPTKNEIYKLISFCGGFASISFILYVAQNEIIEELTASTLRIGEKQFNAINRLYKENKIKRCSFLVGSIMKQDKKSGYDYYGRFIELCNLNNWNVGTTNNHSKIILMKTAKNYYVIETSSNLNENPQVEQFSFENDRQLYEFYYNFFENIKSNKIGDYINDI